MNSEWPIGPFPKAPLRYDAAYFNSLVKSVEDTLRRARAPGKIICTEIDASDPLIVSVVDYGMDGNAATNATTEWNAAIADLNAGVIKGLYIPAGYTIRLTGAHTTSITATDAIIFGDGQDVSKITMSAGAGTSAKFFSFDGASDFTIRGIGFYNLNSTSLVAGSWQFEAYDCARITLEDIWQQGGPFLRMGGSTVGPNQLKLRNITGSAYKALGSPHILVEDCSGAIWQDVRFGADNAAAHADFRFVKLCPQVGDNIDTMTIRDFIANETQNDVTTTFEIDYSYDDIGTISIDRTNLEQSLKALHVHNNNASTGFLSRLILTNVRTTPRITTAGSVGFHVQNTNNKLTTISASMCTFSAGNGPAIKVEGAATDSGYLDLEINNSLIVDRRQGLAGAKSAVEIGASGVALRDCKFLSSRTAYSDVDYITGSTFDVAVEFTADVKRAIITGNDFQPCTAAEVIDTTLITGLASGGNWSINNNLGTTAIAVYPNTPSIITPIAYGADPTGAADSYAAFVAAHAAMVDGDCLVIPPGTYALSAEFQFTKLRSTFDCQGRLIPFSTYSGYLVSFELATSGGDTTQINIGQRVNIRRLYIDGLWQSRGVRFEGVYCTAMHAITVTRAYGTALEIGSNCYENSWHGINLNLGKNRLKFATPADWSSATAYVVGDRVTYPHAAYAGATTYSAGALVRDVGISYMSIASGNVGNTPASSPLKWARIDDSYFECMIGHTNFDPFSATIYTTNNGTAGNRYWKPVLQYEPLLNIEHTETTGVTDHQYIYGLDIRDSDNKYLMYVDNNGNERSVYAIEVHGGIIHTMTPGVVAHARNTGGLADPDKARHIVLGRTIDCKFIGVNTRIGACADAIGVMYGMSAPGKTSYAMQYSGRIDGEGARQIGILSGAGNSVLTTQSHFINGLFSVLTDANSQAYIDPFNDIGYDVEVPLRAKNVGRRATRVGLSAATQAIANITEAALIFATPAAADDVHGLFAAGTPTRLTIPHGWEMARVSCNIVWAVNSGGSRHVKLYKNGSAPAGGFNLTEVSSGAAYPNRQGGISDILDVSAGDYFEVIVFHNSGGSLDVVQDNNTWVAVERIL